MIIFVRYDAIAAQRRRERQELLLRNDRRDDARHSEQRVPGIRHARERHVRNQVGDDSEYKQARSHRHTRRRATGPQGLANRRIRALCRLHCRPRSLADEGPKRHQRM